MKTPHKLAVCILALVGLLVPQLAAAQKQGPIIGITTYNMQDYIHAKKVLKEQYPEFLTEFNLLAQNIADLQSTDEAGQYQALMEFFPSIEKMLEIKPSISTNVIVSYFTIALETADVAFTDVNSLLFNAFKVELAGGDASGILSEENLMKKHNLSLQEAQHIRTVLHKLYPTSTLL